VPSALGKKMRRVEFSSRTKTHLLAAVAAILRVREPSFFWESRRNSIPANHSHDPVRVETIFFGWSSDPICPL